MVDSAGPRHSQTVKSALLACLLPLPLAAATPSWNAYECLFTTECVGVEACASTNFDLSFRQVQRPAVDTGRIDFDPVTPPGLTEVQTVYGNFTGFAAPKPPEDIVNWLHVTDTGDMHLFSLSNGTARYSLHMPASDLALFYKGTCEMISS